MLVLKPEREKERGRFRASPLLGSTSPSQGAVVSVGSVVSTGWVVSVGDVSDVVLSTPSFMKSQTANRIAITTSTAATAMPLLLFGAREVTMTSRSVDALRFES